VTSENPSPVRSPVAAWRACVVLVVLVGVAVFSVAAAATAGIGFAAGALWSRPRRAPRVRHADLAATARSATTRPAATPTASSAMQAADLRDASARIMALELAYERSRSVFESLREGVIVDDDRGEIVLANPVARRAMKVAGVEPVGSVLWDALADELGTRAKDAWSVLRDSAVGGDDVPTVRYSGIPCRQHVYDLTAVTVTSRRTGQDFGTVFLVVDSTRTHELQQLKDRFLSNVSHELRTPLTNICAYAEILQTLVPGETAEWPDFVRIVHEESVELSRLVDGMFDYLQLESGEAVFVDEELDGAAIAREACTQILPKARRRHIDVQFELVGEPPKVLVDRARLSQVVRHLVDNAIKFSPEGGRVRVAVGVRDEGFELRVEDCGPGVPLRDRQAVFEKFHQLSDHMTAKAAGTGIGLATSRVIVARFGGLIWCEAAPQGGACFVVMLPGARQPRLAVFGAGTGAGGGF
jgi:two-component system, OmpR family, phosphate regulon sensor histidine kinase PhoR